MSRAASRRDFLRGSAATLAAAGLWGGEARAVSTSGSRAVVRAQAVRLRLRHTWTTVMSSSATRDVCYVSYSRDGLTGHGEGAPIPRYHETAQSAIRAVESVRPLLESADPREHAALLEAAFGRLSGEYAARSAIDGAVLDWVGQKLGLPIYRYFGLDPARAPISTMSIGIDTPEITRLKVREAADFPVLKVKVGLSTDEATIEAVRSETKKPLRVDANEGWKDPDEALRKIRWLEKLGVELIEQPLPAAMLDEQRKLRDQVEMPIFADEACLHPDDIPRLASAYDGVNIKLDKCGGIWEAFRMIQIARAFKLKVMIGCMISSSVAISMAAHLAPLVDYIDLDGALLIDNDPYQGVVIERGRLVYPDRPGLGLVPRQLPADPERLLV